MTLPILLIIDDDHDLLEMYEEIFVIPGVEVVTKASAQEALHFCQKEERVRVIISDANMGEMSGEELLVNLRSYYETMPVFYLLTGAFNLTEAEIKEKGGHGLILKPFDLNEILGRIKRDLKI